MCRTEWLQSEGRVRATHLTTHRTAEVEWDDRAMMEENHAAAATLILGRAPEFQTGTWDGGFVFGVDPEND